METLDAIEQIETDFEAGNEPFDDVTFPEERLLNELPHSSMEDRAQILSMFATFDYNRNASNLVDNIIDLYYSTNRFMFDPWGVTDKRNFEEKAVEEFEEIGFRYPNRDVHAWYENCCILREKYSGKWTELYLSVGTDAVSLVERLNDDDFLCIKGDKIAPMYARFVDEYIAPMSNVWELEIPVDTHIKRLSRELFDAPDLSKDAIRAEWRGVAIETGINRHIVDAALWQIGNNWSGWGEDYWEKL